MLRYHAIIHPSAIPVKLPRTVRQNTISKKTDLILYNTPENYEKMPFPFDKPSEKYLFSTMPPTSKISDIIYAATHHKFLNAIESATIQALAEKNLVNYDPEAHTEFIEKILQKKVIQDLKIIRPDGIQPGTITASQNGKDIIVTIGNKSNGTLTTVEIPNSEIRKSWRTHRANTRRVACTRIKNGVARTRFGTYFIPAVQTIQKYAPSPNFSQQAIHELAMQLASTLSKEIIDSVRKKGSCKKYSKYHVCKIGTWDGSTITFKIPHIKQFDKDKYYP